MTEIKDNDLEKVGGGLGFNSPVHGAHSGSERPDADTDKKKVDENGYCDLP